MRIRVGTFPVSKRRLVYFWFGTQVQGVSFLIGLLFKYVWEQAIKDYIFYDFKFKIFQKR